MWFRNHGLQICGLGLTAVTLSLMVVMFVVTLFPAPVIVIPHLFTEQLQQWKNMHHIQELSPSAFEYLEYIEGCSIICWTQNDNFTTSELVLYGWLLAEFYLFISSSEVVIVPYWGHTHRHSSCPCLYSVTMTVIHHFHLLKSKLQRYSLQSIKSLNFRHFSNAVRSCVSIESCGQRVEHSLRFVTSVNRTHSDGLWSECLFSRSFLLPWLGLCRDDSAADWVTEPRQSCRLFHLAAALAVCTFRRAADKVSPPWSRLTLCVFVS